SARMFTMDEAQVFISWSGEQSRQIAELLRGWLPNLWDGIRPWMSDVDIAAGARGLEKIHQSLSSTVAGIIVVTPENSESPWVNYEAGALSRALQSEASVTPLLTGFARKTDLRGPLAQFQVQMLDHDGIRHLVGTTLSELLNVDPNTSRRRFDAF